MKIYFGWYVVALTVLAFTLAVGGSIQAYGLFVLPVSQAFHLTRAEVNTGAIVLNIGMALASPILGRIIDRRSARMVMAVSAVIFGASFIVLGLSTNLWLSTIVLAVAVGGAVVGCSTLTAPVLVARWFTIHRGRAMAISTLGVSMGPVVTIPLISLVLEAVGWRHCLILLGVAMGAVLLLLAVFIRNAPGPNDREPGSPDSAALHATDRAVTEDKPLSMGQLLRLPQFWTIAIASALAFAILTTNLVSLVPFAQGEGFSITQAASVMSVYGAAALLGALLFAWLGDRFDRLIVFAILAVLLGASTGGLLLGHSYAAIVACTALMGIAGGAISPAFLALLADWFGTASFGTAAGAGTFLSTFVSAIGIRFGGEVFDRTGSYRLMFLSFLIIGVFAAALMLATRPVSRRNVTDAAPAANS